MPIKKQWAIGVAMGVAGACAVGAAGFTLWHRPAHRPAEAAASEAVLDVTGPGGGSASSLANAVSSTLFPLGAEQSYSLKESSRLSTTSGQTLTQLDLQGTLRIVGLQTSPTIVVRAEFDGKLEIVAEAPDGGQVLQEVESGLADAVHEPFFLEYTSEGAFRRGLGDPKIKAYLAKMWTSFGEYLQFVRASKEDQWQVRESDRAGHYTADYERRAAGEVVKRKLRYETLTAQGLKGLDVLASNTTFQLDSNFALQALDLSEDTRATAGGGPMPGFDGSAKMTLARVGDPAHVADEQISNWLADAGRAVPFDDIQAESDERARDQARIGTFTLASAYARMQTFENADAGHDEKERASRAFVAFAALLRQNPENLAFVRAELGKKGPMTTTLLAALRDASTPESLKVLADMTGTSTSPLDPEDRMEAARDLSRAPTPDADSVRALKALRSDPEVATQATYGLGSALHNLQGQDPVVANDVRQTLTQQLTSATDDLGRANALIAFGNAGDAASLELIRSYTTDPSAQVRASAAQGLRRIPGPEADELLAQLSTDPAPEVRYAAADAISERSASPTLANALAALALHEPVDTIRAKAVDTLAVWLPDLPAIAPTLKVVAAADTNADLRNVARVALQKAS
jgi:hypothetical protein